MIVSPKLVYILVLCQNTRSVYLNFGTIQFPKTHEAFLCLSLFSLVKATFVFSLVKYTPLKFNNTLDYPWWGILLGWWFTLSSTLIVPLWMIFKVAITPGTLRKVSSFFISCFFCIFIVSNISPFHTCSVSLQCSIKFPAWGQFHA